MDGIFIVTTFISVVTNILQYIFSKRYYNIIFLHYSLVELYPLTEVYEFTSLWKAKRMARHSAVVFVGYDPSVYQFDWVILPESSQLTDPRILHQPSLTVFKGLLQ